MKVTSLVENTSRAGWPTEHGLSLHIEADDGRSLLFDMGQRRLFADNAQRMGVDLARVDLAVVSHGHYDHGGGLRAFLELNPTAKVYVNRHAFEPHYSLRQEGLKYIGLDPELRTDARIVCCGEVERLDDRLILFAGVPDRWPRPAGNRLLFGPGREEHDDFRHEQSLLVKERGRTVLFAGCAHAGLPNIMERAEQVAGCRVTHVFSGMHLVKSGLTAEAEAAQIRAFAGRLMEHAGCHYFTMHCTGLPQYAQLKQEMGDAIDYMSAGDVVEL